MAASSELRRVALVGASSLRGKELKELLEERNFPASEIRLVDDEAVGALTEAGGEATFIRPLEDDTFEGAQLVFFAGDPAGTESAWPLAQKLGATLIDLSGVLPELPTAVPWIPALDEVLPPPRPIAGKLFWSPGAAAQMACAVSGALAAFEPSRLVLVFFQPVSERGQPGIDELERQTVNLLSFQPAPQELYDAQVAFNLLPRYGDSSRERLGDVRLGLARDVDRYLSGRAPRPAIQLVQAPVFHATALAGYAEFASPPNTDDFHRALTRAGVRLAERSDPPLSNVSVAGESQILFAPVEPDPLSPKGLWFWGAADNLRLAAANAVTIAEKLLANAETRN
jgi:aspartate-semialdehyde dehydrogenase